MKKGIVQLVSGSAFPHGARFGVLAFRAPTKALGMMVDSSKGMTQLVLGLTPVADYRGKSDSLKEILDGMKVGGATPTGEGLKAAVQALRDPPDTPRRRIKKVVLVTDDKSNFGPRPDSVVDAALVRGAMVDVVAIEKAGDLRAFETLVRRSGGRMTVVNDAAGLAMALNPNIPYVGQPAENLLLVEAERVASVLKLTGKSDPSYKGLVAAAVAVRSRLQQKLQETVELEGQARADLDLALSGAASDPKWPTMSMREFADRVWSRGADLAKLQALEEAYRQAVTLLPAQ